MVSRVSTMNTLLALLIEPSVICTMLMSTVPDGVFLKKSVGSSSILLNISRRNVLMAITETHVSK